MSAVRAKTFKKGKMSISRKKKSEKLQKKKNKCKETYR